MTNDFCMCCTYLCCHKRRFCSCPLWHISACLL